MRLAATPSVGVPDASCDVGTSWGGGKPIKDGRHLEIGHRDIETTAFTAYNRLSVACCLAAWLGGGRPALLAAPRRVAAPVAPGMGVRSEALPPGTISGVLGVC